MLRLPCLLATIALSLGCATGDWWQRDLQEWRGAPVSELLDAWGPPVRTLTGEDEETLLVFERARQLDHGLEEKLRDPGSRLRPDRDEPAYQPVHRSECTVYFEISEEHVTAARAEGAACNIVPRDPARRHADPAGRRR
jgi:hypothetical protein